MNRARERGFTLVELMIALALGTLVVAAVISVFLSNKRTYTTNNALSQVQDNSRVAFELLARDIREAGLTGCGNPGRIANVLNNGPNGSASVKPWYANYTNAIQGYDGGKTDGAVTSGTAVAQRVSSASSIELVGADGAGYSIASNDPANAKMTLNETGSNLGTGDIVVVCDPDHATVAQITTYTAAAGTTPASFNYAKDTTTSPGNCSSGLGFPTSCGTANSYGYLANAQVAKLYVADWYVGYNPVGGKSLYRMTLVNSAGTPTATAQEMVRNITDLQISYHTSGGTAFGNATGVTDWTTVDAVSIQLQLQSAEQISGSNAKPLARSVNATITLRNRV